MSDEERLTTLLTIAVLEARSPLSPDQFEELRRSLVKAFRRERFVVSRLSPREPPRNQIVGHKQEQILVLLATGPKRPGELHEALGGAYNTVYYALRKLASKGLVERLGRDRYGLVTPPVTSTDADSEED